MRYDFKCPECGEIREATKHDAILFCFHEGKGELTPHNDSPNNVIMKRVYSNINISFDGSGFYVNDKETGK